MRRAGGWQRWHPIGNGAFTVLLCTLTAGVYLVAAWPGADGWLWVAAAVWVVLIVVLERL